MASQYIYQYKGTWSNILPYMVPVLIFWGFTWYTLINQSWLRIKSLLIEYPRSRHILAGLTLISLLIVGYTAYRIIQAKKNSSMTQYIILEKDHISIPGYKNGDKIISYADIENIEYGKNEDGFEIITIRPKKTGMMYDTIELHEEKFESEEKVAELYKDILRMWQK